MKKVKRWVDINDSLPYELILEILLFLDKKVVFSTFNRVCKYWNDVSEMEVAYKYLIQRDVGETPLDEKDSHQVSEDQEPEDQEPEDQEPEKYYKKIYKEIFTKHTAVYNNKFVFGCDANYGKIHKVVINYFKSPLNTTGSCYNVDVFITNFGKIESLRALGNVHLNGSGIQKEFFINQYKKVHEIDDDVLFEMLLLFGERLGFLSLDYFSQNFVVMCIKKGSYLIRTVIERYFSRNHTVALTMARCSFPITWISIRLRSDKKIIWEFVKHKVITDIKSRILISNLCVIGESLLRNDKYMINLVSSFPTKFRIVKKWDWITEAIRKNSQVFQSLGRFIRYTESYVLAASESFPKLPLIIQNQFSILYTEGLKKVCFNCIPPDFGRRNRGQINKETILKVLRVDHYSYNFLCECIKHNLDVLKAYKEGFDNHCNRCKQIEM